MAAIRPRPSFTAPAWSPSCRPWAHAATGPAQLEGGIAAERLQLAAFTLGFGATGLTFLDDDVSAFFGTHAAPMLAVAVGAPAYRARTGKRPAQLPHIGLAER